MNDHHFEQELRALSPTPPSRSLEQRIAAELAPALSSYESPVKPGWLEWLISRLAWSALGAAVALAVSGFFSPADPTSLTRPVAAKTEAPESPPTVIHRTAEILNASDEGLTDDGEQGLARQVRLTSVERRTWVEASGVNQILIPQNYAPSHTRSTRRVIQPIAQREAKNALKRSRHAWSV